MFSVHACEYARPFLNSSGLKSVFQKLCFGDELVCTASLTLQNKAVSIFKFMRRSVHAASGIEKGRVLIKATGHHYEFLLPNWIVY